MNKEKGFTLLELIMVITIVGIVAEIAVPSVFGMIEKCKTDVCNVNTAEVERHYEAFSGDRVSKAFRSGVLAISSYL